MLKTNKCSIQGIVLLHYTGNFRRYIVCLSASLTACTGWQDNHSTGHFISKQTSVGVYYLNACTPQLKWTAGHVTCWNDKQRWCITLSGVNTGNLYGQQFFRSPSSPLPSKEQKTHQNPRASSFRIL